MDNLNLSSVVSRNDDVAYTYIDDEMVLMGAEDGLYYGINCVGAEIWKHLENGMMYI